MPGLKVISAHIKVLDHFPVYSNGYQAFARVQREIVETATVIVVMVVIGCLSFFLIAIMISSLACQNLFVATGENLY